MSFIMDTGARGENDDVEMSAEAPRELSSFSLRRLVAAVSIVCIVVVFSVATASHGSGGLARVSSLRRPASSQRRLHATTCANTTKPIAVIDLSKPFEDGKSKVEDWRQFTQAMVDYRNRKAGNVEGWVIVEDGEIVSEWYNTGYDGNHKFHLWSGTKPITGMMLGMMSKDNRFTLNQTLEQLIPNRADDPKSEFAEFWRRNPDKAAIPVKNMLSMSSGLSADLGSCARTWATCGGLDEDAAQNPGFSQARVGQFDYLEANNLLSYVMKTATGKDPAEYAQSVLFPLLGIGNFKWWKVTERFLWQGSGFQHISTAFHGAMLTIRDYAKIGQFALQGGVSKPGEQSKLPSWWGSLSVDHPDGGDYNAGFWFPNRLTKRPEEQSGYIEGAMGKTLYWQKTPRGGRVIAIIHLDDFLDKSQNGQECWSHHCAHYDQSGTHSEPGPYLRPVPDSNQGPAIGSSSGGTGQSRLMLDFALANMC